MSLTQFLNKPGDPILKKKFSEVFAKPEFIYKRTLKAPPLTQNFGTIGTAYDYVLRFKIEFCNKNKKVERDEWLAEYAYKRFAIKFTGDKLEALIFRYSRAKENYKKYISNGRMSDTLLADGLFLAKLDLYYRIGLIAPDLFRENPLDIKDLKNLYRTITKTKFLATKRIILNPSFGAGSDLVDGADADFIIDDTLIEIKVTKHLKLERSYLNQLIGYYTLGLIGDVNGKNAKREIKYIGVYYPRYDVLWRVPISTLGKSKVFDDFKRWFITYFNDMKEKNEKLRQKRILEIEKEMRKLEKTLTKH